MDRLSETLRNIATALNLDDHSPEAILQRIDEWRSDRDKAWAEAQRLRDEMEKIKAFHKSQFTGWTKHLKVGD